VPFDILINVAAEYSRGDGGEPKAGAPIQPAGEEGPTIRTAKEVYSDRQPTKVVIFGVPPEKPHAFVPLVLAAIIVPKFSRPPPSIPLPPKIPRPPPIFQLTPKIPKLTPCINCGPVSSVDKIVGRTQAQLEKCRIKDNRRDRDPSKPDRFDCVADALEKAADELSKQPEFKKAEKIIRRAATKVRKAKTVKQATAALSTAKKQLLRSSGLILVEHQKLASLTDTAKSVLRS
jgi:hypothetical protein